jgi:hypothetical protein
MSDPHGKLVQPETYLYIHLRRHRNPVLHARSKLPFLHRFDGFLIETQTERSCYANVAGVSGWIHHDREYDSTLILRFAGFLRILRIRVVNCSRGGYASARAKNPITASPSRARSKSRSITDSDSRAMIVAHAAVPAGPIRRNGWVRCQQIAELI